MRPMKQTVWIALIAICCAAARSAGAADAPKSRDEKTSVAWTLPEAKTQLQFDPRDPYMQYVVLQLSRGDKELDNTLRQIGSGANAARGRANNVDLFSIFTGALAVQESLQLDTMRGENTGRPVTNAKVDLANLKGPTIKSHPWAQMLAGRKPRIAALARMVPADQYYVQCRSLTKMLEFMDVSDLWATHLFNQAAHDATSSRVNERMQEQLAVHTEPLMRPFYDFVVDQVAITGSDLYLREGSDVTLLFQLKQPEVFKARMDDFLKTSQQAHRGSRRSSGKYRGVDYVHLTSDDRKVHVFSAYPRPDVHVRSNSKVALERVLALITANVSEPRSTVALGDTDEFKYIRTMLPEGAPEEDVLVYLSDPFIHHLVGPKLKLTERRRLLVYNHLRMLGHASMLHRTQHGRTAGSIQELVEARCAPSQLADPDLRSALGGKYSLSADGTLGLCSVTGSALRLTPCCELPLNEVTKVEADEYKAFLDQYNQYWRTYFDPIAVRLQITPERYRAETIVLPLLDNSVYRSLSEVLGGRAEPLDALPVPKGNIFSIALRFNKAAVLKQTGRAPFGIMHELMVRPANDLKPKDVETFFLDGLGSQIGLHVYDSAQLFDFNLPAFLGQTMGTFNSGRGLRDESLWIAALISAINSPIYVSWPVADRKIVDEFLDKLDPLLAARARETPARNPWFATRFDYFEIKSPQAGPKVRAVGLQFGPLKWRFFYARVGEGLFMASKKFVLDDLIEAEAMRGRNRNGKKKSASSEAVAHAMVRLRPENWNRVLPDYQLGWAENERQASLNNVARLSAVARAYVAEHPDAARGDRGRAAAEIQREASKLYGVYFLSLDGGQYQLAPDGKSMVHSVYGSPAVPRQPPALNPNGELARLLGELKCVTAELTFLDDGLHAVVTLDKQEKKAKVVSSASPRAGR